MSKPVFLLVIGAVFLANGMNPWLSTGFGVVFVLWAYVSAKRGDK